MQLPPERSLAALEWTAFRKEGRSFQSFEFPLLVIFRRAGCLYSAIEHEGAGRPIHTMSRELELVAGRPLRLARLRRERRSVVVASPAAPAITSGREEAQMRRVIGIDVHRTFGEVVIWEDGILRHAGRVDMTRTALEGMGRVCGRPMKW